MDDRNIIQPGMRVAVMGLGVSGRAAVRFALASGARVMISDCRGQEEFVGEAGAFLEATGAAWEAGGHTAEFLGDADLVIVSPGVVHDHQVVRQLQAASIPCLGELAICAPLLDVPVVAVTGTNGKTTVTTLIGEVLQTAGKRVFVGGNIGTPLYNYFAAKESAEVIVLEVSSFQLQMAGDFAPTVALLLNITPDHLDWHASLAEYSEAKFNIFRHQQPRDFGIVAADDPRCCALIERIPSRVLTFGADPSCNARIEQTAVSLNWHGAPEVYDLACTPMHTPIGLANSAAVILAARALGCDSEAVREGLASFQPLPHRIELVRELDGVTYINDSKATNTGAVVAALAQVRDRAVLIAGGKHKGEDYSSLCASVASKVRTVLLIGEAAPEIAAALGDVTDTEYCASLEEAVRRARQLAQPGDTVLLSPACASFDMFRSYGHRGEVFAAAVHALAHEHDGNRGENGDG